MRLYSYSITSVWAFGSFKYHGLCLKNSVVGLLVLAIDGVLMPDTVR